MTRRTITITVSENDTHLHLKAVGVGIDPDRVADYLDTLAHATRTHGLTHEHGGWRITTTTKEKK